MINTVDQFLTCYGLNRRYIDCFHLNICNMRPDGRAMKAFRKAIPYVLFYLEVSLVIFCYFQF